jgi:hypothetical protein
MPDRGRRGGRADLAVALAAGLVLLGIPCLIGCLP